MIKPILDIIVVGDLRESVCRRSTIVSQLTALAQTGYRIGFLQLKSILIDRPEPLHDDLRTMIEDGQIEQLDPDLLTCAKLVIASDPVLFTYPPKRPLRIDAQVRVVVVRDCPIDVDGDLIYDWQTLCRNAEEVLGGSVLFAPIHQSVRHQLTEIDPRPELTGEDWHDVLDVEAWRRPDEGLRGSRPVVGRCGEEDAGTWPTSSDALLAAYPDDRQIVVRLLGGGSVLREIVRPYPHNWEVLPDDHSEARRFLSSLDFYVHTYHPSRARPVEPSILEAMASGVVAILPPSFEPIFGDAAVYADLNETRSTVWRLYQDRAAYVAQRRAGVDFVQRTHSQAGCVDRVRALIGSPEKSTGAGQDSRGHRVPNLARSRRRVLFITINGVGMGHLTRMLAIARRCPAPIEPVFLTMSQALKVVREQGFLAEYVPSRSYLNCDLMRWNGYLRDEVIELISFYDPAAVLFDGNVPYQGIIDAIKANPDPWYVWSRRGMWRAGNADILAREEYFDAVLEPGDLADDYDHGMTTKYRSRTRRVRPIRLLDAAEMLPRDEARRELGLSAERPAVLIQLGAGNNFNYLSILKTAFAHISEHHKADIAVGEWLISDAPLDLPPNIVRLPGYPFARYFNAFDLAISAVGYNSFHELIYAGLPTILVPNEAMEQDNQLARALYADRHGLAACVRTKEIYSFTGKIDQLLDPHRRQHMKERLGAVEPENGAAEAAAFIEEMVYSRKVDQP